MVATEEVAGRTSPAQPRQTDPPIAFRLPMMILLVALGAKGVVETDIWGHMRFGLDLIATRALPVMDHYSFTSDQRWINHEWASDVVFALSYSRGGLPLLTGVRALSVTVALWALNRAMARTAWLLRDGLLVAVIFVTMPLLAAVRPQIFSIPLYSLTLLALVTDAAWLPLVFAVWANVHGGWMLGLGAVFVRSGLEPSRRRVILAVACAVATLVNPYGVHLWISLVDAIHRGWNDVLEWRPVWDFTRGPWDAVLWSVVAAGCVYAAATRVRVHVWAWVWTLCVAIASARARRHIPFFAITAAVLLLSRTRFPVLAVPKRAWSITAGLVLLVPIAAAAVMGLTVVLPTATCLPPQEPPVRPEASAVRFIRDADLHGRMLMWFDWGEYAIWHVGDRLKVSIDNRRETIYSARTVQDHLQFYAGTAPDYPDRIAADYVWLPVGSAPASQLQNRGWHVLFRGPRSIILGRGKVANVIGVDDRVQPCFPQP